MQQKQVSSEENILTMTTEQLQQMIDQAIKAHSASLVTREDLARSEDRILEAAKANAVQLVGEAKRELDGKLEIAINRIESKVNTLFQGFTDFSKRYDDWVQMRSSQFATLENDQRVTERNMISLRDEHQRTRTVVKGMYKTIHGDPQEKDGQPSLFAMMLRLESSMNSIKTELGEKIDDAGKKAETSASRWEKQDAAHERWQKPIKGFLRWIVKSPLNIIATGVVTALILLLLQLIAPAIAALVK